MHRLFCLCPKLADSWTAVGNEVPIGGNSGGGTSQPNTSDDPVTPNGPTTPDDPSDSYTVITIDGKTPEAIKTEVSDAIAAGNKDIKLAGQVTDGLFKYNQPFNVDLVFSSIDISETTGWDRLSYTLPKESFCAVQVSKIIVPESIKIIGEYAFGESDIESIILPGATALSAKSFKSCKKLIEVNAPKTVQIDEGVFTSCRALSVLKLTAPKINKIDSYAFEYINTSGIDLWLNKSEKSNIVSTKNWQGYTWNSITLVDDEGNVVETIQ